MLRLKPASVLTAALGGAGKATVAGRLNPATRYLSSSSSPSSSSADDGQTIIGIPENGIRMSVQSKCRVRDIVGFERGAGTGGGTCVSGRMPAGDLLSLIDICAARASSKHVFGKFTMGLDGDHTASVATVAMDNLLFKHPVMHGDLIDLVGSCVHVGASSIAVNVDVRRVQFGSNVTQLVANALVFMVAVDRSLKAAKIVPALQIDASERDFIRDRSEAVLAARAHMKRYKALRNELDTLDHSALVERCPPTTFELDPTKRYHVGIEETKHVVNRLFFPSHLNLNNTVFGGEILRWMEMHAVHCGRAFAGNRNVFTIGMHAIEFNEPVFKSDWMRLEAHVVFVKRSTMEVDVRVTAERDGRVVTTNKANFVLTSLDEAGQPQATPGGLNIRVPAPSDEDGGVAARSTADPPSSLDDAKATSSYWLRRHLVAAQRYAWLRESSAPSPTSESLLHLSNRVFTPTTGRPRSVE